MSKEKTEKGIGWKKAEGRGAGQRMEGTGSS